MKLHGFKQLTNYSFNASYHFIVSGLILLPSPIVGPVTVEIPERGLLKLIILYVCLEDNFRNWY